MVSDDLMHNSFIRGGGFFIVFSAVVPPVLLSPSTFLEYSYWSSLIGLAVSNIFSGVEVNYVL